MLDREKALEIVNKAECLYDESAIYAAFDRMAEDITARVGQSNPLILCAMKGAIFVTTELTKRLHFPLEIDYAHATRYQDKLRPGDLHWRVEPRLPIQDRTVVVLDDVLDGGLTLHAIVDYCQVHGAKEVLTAVLVDKDRPREPLGLEKADFTGLFVEDRWLFGCGLDYMENLRHYMGIYAVADEHVIGVE